MKSTKVKKKTPGEREALQIGRTFSVHLELKTHQHPECEVMLCLRYSYSTWTVTLKTVTRLTFKRMPCHLYILFSSSSVETVEWDSFVLVQFHRGKMWKWRHRVQTNSYFIPTATEQSLFQYVLMSVRSGVCPLDVLASLNNFRCQGLWVYFRWQYDIRTILFFRKVETQFIHTGMKWKSFSTGSLVNINVNLHLDPRHILVVYLKFAEEECRASMKHNYFSLVINRAKDQNFSRKQRNKLFWQNETVSRDVFL